VKILRLFLILVLCVPISSAQTVFTKPSDAYAFARQPKTEWEEVLREGREPATPTLPGDIVEQRGKTLCPLFSLESVSGEELYWLAKLCELDHPKALLALERYLEGIKLEHGPAARLLLAVLHVRSRGSWEAAWGTLRTVLEQDPIEPYGEIDIAIEEEAKKDPAKALAWSQERYAILLHRRQTEKPGPAAVATTCLLTAGSELVHLYYLAGKNAQAEKLLDEMNRFVKSGPEEAKGWGAEDLHWANLEMHPAPEITVLKAMGGKPDSAVIDPARVAVISFFFLGCAPCMSELSELNKLQKRYGKEKLRVTAVTTYKMNSYLTPSTHSNIEVSLEKAHAENWPRISVVLTSEETLARYGVGGFPAVAIVDKEGRVRYISRDINFEDDDSLGLLIHRLVEE